MIHPVMHRAQIKKYDCGPTSLAMLLDFYGIAHVAEDLDALCETTAKHGTEHSGIVKAAQSLGAGVCVHENAQISDIEEVLEKGHPVLVNYFNPVTSVGHFAVIKGVDNGHVVMADPKNGDNFKLSLEAFDGLWHNHSKTLWHWMMHLVV
jgi:ABC-type bacteriocin/lantibiotic exporter with double-glycine peptidase domain